MCFPHNLTSQLVFFEQQPDYWVLNQKAHRAARCVASGEAGRAASRAASPKRMRGRQPMS